MKQTYSFLVLSALLALLITGDALFAWTAPGANPTAGNVAAPLHTGAANQDKSGSLGVGALSVFGRVYVQGVSAAPQVNSTAALEVDGFIAATGYCAGNGQNCSGPLPTCSSGQTLVADASGSWVCGTATPVPPPTAWLVNNQHSESQCTSLGGTVLTDGSARFCRFNQASCPAGWAQYLQWTTTQGGGSACGSMCWGPCSLPRHAWSNTRPATCSEGRTTNCENPGSCRAVPTQVGCY